MLGWRFGASATSLSAPEAIAATPSAAPRSMVRREISAGLMMR